MLTRTATVHEMSLAQVTLANGYSTIGAGQITDERIFADYRLRPDWYTPRREYEITRDGTGLITRIKNYVPDKTSGYLRWEEVFTRNGSGQVTTITRITYSAQGDVVFQSVETVSRDVDGNISGGVIV